MTDRVAYPRHPAHLDPYIEVLGHELAVTFLIAMGGCRARFPSDPGGRSYAEALIGPEALRELSRRMPSEIREIPFPRSWLIRALHAEGMTHGQICRALKTSDRNVRETLADRSWSPARQEPLDDLPLFRFLGGSD
jgi:hypothetical protein